jgi:hypothetical protein
MTEETFKGTGKANFTWVPYDDLADSQKAALATLGATVEEWNENDPSLQESESVQEAAKLNDEQTQENWWDGWDDGFDKGYEAGRNAVRKDARDGTIGPKPV